MDPDEAESVHLAACDECLDVLVALGEGLESLESLGASSGLASLAPAPLAAEHASVGAPPAGAPRSPRADKRRFGVVLGGLGFAFAAAAAVGVQAYREAPPLVDAPTQTPVALPAPVAARVAEPAPAAPERPRGRPLATSPAIEPVVAPEPSPRRRGPPSRRG